MDVWTTSDPDQINEFLTAAKRRANTFNATSSNWHHFSDDDFLHDGLNLSNGGFSYQYSTVENGVCTINLLQAPGMHYMSDPDSHYDPITGCYNLYTANETNDALKTYATIAGGEILGPALGAVAGRAFSGLSKIGSKIIGNIAERFAAKSSAAGFQRFGSLTEKFGEGYESVVVAQGKHFRCTAAAYSTRAENPPYEIWS